MATVPLDPKAVNSLQINGQANAHFDLDVIIVGAGFSGISALYRCRKEGLKARIFEAGKHFRSFDSSTLADSW